MSQIKITEPLLDFTFIIIKYEILWKTQIWNFLDFNK